MGTSLRDRAEALDVAVQQAESDLAAAEAALATAEADAHAALVAGDMKKADAAQAVAEQARARIAPARARAEAVRKARREVGAELLRQEHTDQRDRLADTLAAERERLRTLLEDAVAGLRAVQANLRAAAAGEDGFRALQRALADVRVTLGEAEPTVYPDRERPVDTLLGGEHGALLRALMNADLTRGI